MLLQSFDGIVRKKGWFLLSRVTSIFHIPIIDAILFGTILAATDPVAVGVIFKKFPIPYKLNTIIEGESLFNDATGVISFNVVKGIIFSGVAFSLLDASISFIWSMVGAIALGTGIGWIGGIILNKWKADEYIDFTFSLGLAIGGYIVADHYLHVSGVVTTLFIAILIITKHREISIGVRKQFHKYWDYLGFITNSILFFLIGIPLLTVEKAESIGVTIFLIVVAPFVIMMLSRAMVVYGGSTFLRIFRVRIPLQWQNILTLGGLRGGMAVALVLSLSTHYEFKELFTSLIIPLIAINLVVNPILLNQYLKKSNIT